MSESVKNKIIKILSEQTLLDPSEINENLSLEDLGVDSLALVEIVFSIEETFNIKTFSKNDYIYIHQDARAVQGGALKMLCVRTRGFESHS